MQFKEISSGDFEKYSHHFSGIAIVKPRRVWVSNDLLLMEYHEPFTAQRIGLTRLDNEELVSSWSFISDILLEMFPHRTFIEVYPRQQRIVNTGNSRWFWSVDSAQLLHTDLFNLRESNVDRTKHRRS